MLKNYFKIAVRNLLKHRLFSFINIVGLGIAFPFALLALMQFQSSFEFDNWHKDPEQIFRIITDYKEQNSEVSHFASSPFNLADELNNNYAGIEQVTRVVREFNWTLNNRLKTGRVNTIFIDSTFFNIFNFELEKGSKPLEPNTLALSHEMAEWFFGEADPVGKSLHHATFGSFKITGVLKPFKPKTQFKSDVMISMASYGNLGKNTKVWSEFDTHTFLKIDKQFEIKRLDQILSKIDRKANSFLGDSNIHFRAQKLADISPSLEHLQQNPYVEDLADISFNFSIPLMMLLLAGFNYTNLTLARSMSRSREVGVRKVMGAQKKQLVLQFLLEAIIISFLSLLLGLCVLWLMKQSIHVKWITWEVDNPYMIITFFVAFTLFLGFLAGIFPALILSKFQPVKVLKGDHGPMGFGKIGFRRFLSILQFSVTLAFVFQIGHLYSQFDYMATENDNFNRQNIYDLSLQSGYEPKLHQEINDLRAVKKIGYTSQPFGNMPAEDGIRAIEKEQWHASYYYAVDQNFISNMQLDFLAGENLPESLSDSAGNLVVVNENAVKRLGFGSPDQSIGQQIFTKTMKPLTIVGVVKDFCHFNYQSQIQPIVFQYNPSRFSTMSIQAEPNMDRTTFESAVTDSWKKLHPYDESYGSWLDTTLFERYYPSEDMKIMGLTSLVIFAIAIMGLLGILSYTNEKRMKEVGIRKVMGAEIKQIMLLMSWSFIKMLLIAALIAIPIGLFAGYIMSEHLFVFNNGINYLNMAIVLFTILGIALVAVAVYAYRSSTLNPVYTLKNE